MTEAEWRSCTDPEPMLEFLRGTDRASERKLRLFACACCRRVWGLLTHRHVRKALKVAELYADGEATEEKLRLAWGDARWAAQVRYRRVAPGPEATSRWAVSVLCEAELPRALGAAALAARCEAGPDVSPPALAKVLGEQAALLRDIFGAHPLRPVVLDPRLLSWNGGLVVKLAQAAYDERHLPKGALEAHRLAVLADALEEAGCSDAALLEHLRAPGPHVRGCHGIDAVLARG